MRCFRCGAELDTYDVGCYRKLINRGATECMCRDCLAARLGWERAELDRLIRRFQQQGCTMFPPLCEEAADSSIPAQSLPGRTAGAGEEAAADASEAG